MPKRITFQFEDDLDYQMQAIHSTIELFRGLSRNVDGIYRPNRTRKFGEGDPVRNSDSRHSFIEKSKKSTISK